MSDEELQDIVEELSQIEEIRAKERRVLAQLLDKEISHDKKYIAIRGSMGRALTESARTITIPSYSCMHTLKWVGSRDNVFMGSEMDFLKNNIDPETNKLVIDEESAELLRQRAPDWSRQIDLTAYLIQEDSHKFGTILGVLSPAWVDDPAHENWGKDGRAICNSADFEALDSRGDVGLLSSEGVQAYALDGQHRVMGIRGLIDVLEGGITVKSKDGREGNKRFTKEEFLAKLQSDVGKLKALLEEKINIEYIPAVMQGETRAEATQRIRKVFNAINNQAKAPDKGENILLDENHGASIVARRIAHHKMFLNLDGKSRVNWKNKNIASSEKNEFITLQHIRDMVNSYVDNCKDDVPDFEWETDFDTVPIRPPESELSQIECEINSLLDDFAELPTYKGISAGDDLVQLREFPSEKTPNNKGNLLARSVGLPVIFDAVTSLLQNGDRKKLFRKLKKFDEQRGFEVSKPDSPFFMVTYDATKKPARMQVKKGDLKLAADLVKYVLEGAEADDREKLLKRVVKARSVSDKEWLNYEGNAAPIKIESTTLPVDPIIV